MATPNSYAAVTVNKEDQQIKVQWVEGQDASNYLELGTNDFDAKTDHQAGRVTCTFQGHGFTAESPAVEKAWGANGPEDKPCVLKAEFVSSDGTSGTINMTASRDGATIKSSSASVSNAQVKPGPTPTPAPKAG